VLAFSYHGQLDSIICRLSIINYDVLIIIINSFLQKRAPELGIGLI
jgi:hypothetical protein